MRFFPLLDLQEPGVLAVGCQGAEAEQLPLPSRKKKKTECIKITKENTNYFGIHMEMAAYAER